MLAQGWIGWDSGEIAAIRFGPASVPLRLDNTNIYVAPTRVPAGDGHVNLAGRIRYRPGPLSIQLPPGEISQSVRITPEITERWLRFIAPPVADVRGVDGRFDLEIAGGTIVPGDPLQSQLAGRLRVHGADLTMSPLSKELLVAAKRNMVPIMRRPTRNISFATTPKVTMPIQTIEFELARGRVSVRKSVIEIDGIPIVISGDVALDSCLDMTAQIPLDFEWLKPDFRREPGEVIELPVHGTFFHPLVDRQRINDLVSEIAGEMLDRTMQYQRELSESLVATAKSLKRLNENLHELSEQFDAPPLESDD